MTELQVNRTWLLAVAEILERGAVVPYPLMPSDAPRLREIAEQLRYVETKVLHVKVNYCTCPKPRLTPDDHEMFCAECGFVIAANVQPEPAGVEVGT